MADRNATIIDPSHVIEAGMTTFQGLPGPHICDYWNREASAANYDDGSRFQIGRIDMVANTGTYVDIPIGEHLTNLAALPDDGFRFSAVPPKVKFMGTFPVRAWAVLT